MISQNHMSSPIVGAIKQICEEKGIPEAEVLEAIESSLAAAFRKDFGKPYQNVKVTFMPATGDMQVVDVKTVVEDTLKAEWEAQKAEPAASVEEKKEVPPLEGAEEEIRYNPKLHVTLSEARVVKADTVLGEEIRTQLVLPSTFGRVAAQTAKQVIIQKLKESERKSIFEEYKGKEGTVLTGTIGRREREALLVDLGKTTALFPPHEQIPDERYTPGSRFKFLLKEVLQTLRGPSLIVSRASPEFVRAIFAMEIPEVANGAIELKGIARDPGHRTKVAVSSTRENIDPVGSCIGQRGVRVQTVMAELGGEKIDIIEWHEDPVILIGRAISPAKPKEVVLHAAEKRASVRVPSDQLSLAIGRGGQNVRLAGSLTGWTLDLQEEKVPVEEDPKEEVAVEPAPEEVATS